METFIAVLIVLLTIETVLLITQTNLVGFQRKRINNLEDVRRTLEEISTIKSQIIKADETLLSHTQTLLDSYRISKDSEPRHIEIKLGNGQQDLGLWWEIAVTHTLYATLGQNFEDISNPTTIILHVTPAEIQPSSCAALPTIAV